MTVIALRSTQPPVRSLRQQARRAGGPWIHGPRTGISIDVAVSSVTGHYFASGNLGAGFHPMRRVFRSHKQCLGLDTGRAVALVVIRFKPRAWRARNG